MRRLLLFRHSTAERAEPGESDQGRRLSTDGRADAAVMGAYLASHPFRFDQALVSPSTRTQETWRQLAAALRNVPEPVFDTRIYNGAAQALLTVLKQQPREAATLLLIGHNPGLHELATMLVAAGDVDTREQLRENFPTSGLAIIDFALDSWGKLHPRSGRLERFVRPSSIAAATN